MFINHISSKNKLKVKLNIKFSYRIVKTFIILQSNNS